MKEKFKQFLSNYYVAVVSFSLTIVFFAVWFSFANPDRTIIGDDVIVSGNLEVGGGVQGDLGIGTTNPSEQLHIDGGVVHSRDSMSIGKILITNGTTADNGETFPSVLRGGDRVRLQFLTSDAPNFYQVAITSENNPRSGSSRHSHLLFDLAQLNTGGNFSDYADTNIRLSRGYDMDNIEFLDGEEEYGERGFVIEFTQPSGSETGWSGRWMIFAEVAFPRHSNAGGRIKTHYYPN